MFASVTQHHSDGLGTLVDILRWEEDQRERIATWLHSYRRLLLSHFESLQPTEISPDAFIKGYWLLDDDMKTRFLYDPDVTQRLLESSNSSSSRDTSGIADVLSVYLSRTATDRGIDTLRIWKHTTHEGNAVKTVTEFDTGSNFRFPWVAVDVTDLCPVSNRDLPVVREKVERALRCLEIGCSVPRSFFGAFTFRFAVRSEPQRPRSFSSCSFGKYRDSLC